MNRTPHTPGPWHIKSSGIDGNTGYYKFAVSAENGREIVNTRQSVLGATYPELEANARLIALAPEMFDELRLIRGYFDAIRMRTAAIGEYTAVNAKIDRLDALIAKAISQ